MANGQYNPNSNPALAALKEYYKHLQYPMTEGPGATNPTTTRSVSAAPPDPFTMYRPNSTVAEKKDPELSYWQDVTGGWRQGPGIPDPLDPNNFSLGPAPLDLKENILKVLPAPLDLSAPTYPGAQESLGVVKQTPEEAAALKVLTELLSPGDVGEYYKENIMPGVEAAYEKMGLGQSSMLGNAEERGLRALYQEDLKRRGDLATSMFSSGAAGNVREIAMAKEVLAYKYWADAQGIDPSITAAMGIAFAEYYDTVISQGDEPIDFTSYIALYKQGKAPKAKEE